MQLCFLENDFMNTMRLEYVMLQIVKASYVPVKASDFKVGTDVDFPISHNLSSVFCF